MSPFVVEDVRKKIRELGFGEADVVGDLCFIVYSEMMRRWNENPRWTTIHGLKRSFVINAIHEPFLFKVAQELTSAAKYSKYGEDTKFSESDVLAAADLAFDVFMYFHGIPYEIKKREENGDILN